MAKRTIRGTGKKYTGTAGADTLTVVGRKNTVNGARGNDRITVSKGSGHKVYGHAGSDTIIVSAASSSYIYGDDAKGKVAGKDKISINGGKNNTIYGGGGADTISVNKGSGHKVYAQAGNDSIIVKSATGSYIYGQGGKDRISVRGGSGNKIYGDDAKGKVAGSDKITISGGKKNTIYGGKGADTITVNGGSSTIYGGKGNDVFVIGKNSTGKATVMDLRAGAGNLDKVKISGGAVKNIKALGNNRIITGGQSAQLTLKGAKPYKFIVADIDGEYTVSSSSIDMTLKKNYTGSYYASSFVNNIDASYVKSEITTVRGNTKNNRIKVAWVDGGTYQGGAGNDTITVTAGNNHRIYGEDESGPSKGNDTITVTGGNGHTIWGQYGDDSITVKNGTNHYIKGNEGNDTISVTGGHSHEISGGDGNDRITLDYVKGSGNDYYSSTTSVVYAGDGNDTITVKNSSNMSVYGEVGIDTITVSNSSAVYIQPYGDCGIVNVTNCKDTKIDLPTTAGNNVNRVTISGTGNDVTIVQKYKARDIITVNWSNSFGKLNIDAARLGGDQYIDTLKINASISDFNFYRDKSHMDLYIEGKRGGSIFIDGFHVSDNQSSFIKGITFNDGTFGEVRYGNLPEK